MKTTTRKIREIIEAIVAIALLIVCLTIADTAIDIILFPIFLSLVNELGIVGGSIVSGIGLILGFRLTTYIIAVILLLPCLIAYHSFSNTAPVYEAYSLTKQETETISKLTVLKLEMIALSVLFAFLTIFEFMTANEWTAFVFGFGTLAIFMALISFVCSVTILCIRNKPDTISELEASTVRKYS